MSQLQLTMAFWVKIYSYIWFLSSVYSLVFADVLLAAHFDVPAGRRNKGVFWSAVGSRMIVWARASSFAGKPSDGSLSNVAAGVEHV